MSGARAGQKLIVSVVQRDDADTVLKALTDAGFGSIMVSSTGGFLRRGNATIVTVSPDVDVETAISVIRATASERTELRDPGLNLQVTEWRVPQSVQVQTGGASIWVLRTDLVTYLPLLGASISGTGED